MVVYVYDIIESIFFNELRRPHNFSSIEYFSTDSVPTISWVLVGVLSMFLTSFFFKYIHKYMYVYICKKMQYLIFKLRSIYAQKPVCMHKYNLVNIRYIYLWYHIHVYMDGYTGYIVRICSRYIVFYIEYTKYLISNKLDKIDNRYTGWNWFWIK